MNKMLIAVFETETKAYEGLSALKGLHNKRGHYPLCNSCNQ